MKLVIFDMDGTLLSNLKEISTKNREAFRALYKKGYRLGIASGRRVSNIEEVIGEDIKYFDVLFGENGHQTKDLKNQEMISTRKLSKEDIKNIITTFDSETCNFCFFNEQGATFTKKTDFAEDMFQVYGDRLHYLDWREWDEYSKICMPVHVDYKDEYRARVESIKDKPYHGVMTGPGFFEFMSSETSKWKSLEKYLMKYHYTKDDVIAFGDSGNDMEILSNVGFAIAMENADEKVKEICDDVTKYDHSHDGVGQYIIKHLL